MNAGKDNLFLKERAEKNVQKWSQRLEDALTRPSASREHRTSEGSLASIGSMSVSRSQPWFSGFHKVEGEFEKAIKTEVNLRRHEDTRTANPTVRGLFRTKMLSTDEDGVDLDRWRNRNYSIASTRQVRNFHSKVSSRSSRLEGQERGEPDQTSLPRDSSAHRSSTSSGRQQMLFEEDAESWNEPSELAEMTLDDLVDKWDDWVDRNLGLVSAAKM